MTKALKSTVAAAVFGLALSAQAESYVLGVEGMTCPSCASSVTKKLSKLTNTKVTNVDIGGQKVSIDCKGTPNLPLIKEKVSQLGFEVVSVTTL